MPSAAANFATRRPMLPTPTMPSVLPASSVLPTTRVAPQSPFRVSVSMSRVRLTQASMSISACSATACEFEPGAWTTATPSRVAAGMSTVSRPTPCRPTTLSFLQAAIRLAVQLGRMRNSIPSASTAARMSPASVSSSETTTRASRSRSALPSGWIGPASTTSGRDTVAIEAVSSPSRARVLFPGDEDQAGGIEREGRAVEPAVELHAAPALRPQHRRQLVGRVQPDLALADELARVLRLRRRALDSPPPRAPTARRGVERVLDADRPAVHPLALLGRQRAHELVPIPGVEHEHATGLERAPEAVDHQPVLIVGEIADRAEQVHGEVELARELHVPDVLADEPELDPGLGGGLPRPVELGLAEVDAGHLMAASRELDRVAAETAWRVQDARAGAERHGDDVARRVTIVRGDIADHDALVRVVRDHAARRIIHLAAWQVPLCRQDPAKGALVNVVGTANVFEAARASEGRVERVVYASSAAVFGAPELYPPGPIKDDAPRLPATHYGVYKVANEDTARVYWDEHKVPSMGFRPLSVYGPGRDFGVTADPTLAMKSAVLGRAFKIRWGGRTDLVYTEDVARALTAAAASRLDGARVYNLHGASVAIADLVRTIEAAWPRARGLITHVDQPIPFPAALDDARYQRDLGPAPPTALADGLRKTLDEFARLQEDGRLDARELE